ncbi:MAG TPA: hypothetical protein VKL61_01060 [Candidatus Polarisedimenticolia bacterium]|nr:hypothetical protein [Candidatus Polarisedimenticolia bacterium]
MKARLWGRALLIYGVALALRLRNIRGVLTEKRVLFGYDDPYYHLRRILLTLEHFPRVPAFDAYTNFPSGATIIWPPGFDLFVAALAWVVGLGHPSRRLVEVTAALVIPFLGAVTAVLVLLLAEEILGRGRWEAFAAGLLFAALPAQQAISTVGRLDHHVVEMISFGSMLLFFLRAIRDDPGSRYSFWGGFALAAGAFCWTGSILFGAFLIAFGILQLTLDRIYGRPDAGTGRSVLRVLFWGGLLLTPLVLASPGIGRESFTFLLLSWYQPVLFLLSAFLVAALSGALYAPSDRRGKMRAARGYLISALLFTVGVYLVARGSGGIDFLARRNPVISLLVESWPIWTFPVSRVIEYFSYLIFFLPFVAAALIWVVVRARFGDVRHNLLLALFLFTAVLGVLQARFLNYFAVPFCIATMWAFREVVDAIRHRLVSPVSRGAAAAACAAALVIPLSPTLRASVHSLPNNMSAALAYLYPSLEWMRDRTPKTSYYMKPEKKPEYGVLADFSFGHWITAIGERPNFCNPFSLAPWHDEPIIESARLFLSEKEAPVDAAFDRNQLRYVVLYGTENALADYARLLGAFPDEYLLRDAVTGRAIPTARFFRTFGVRLALADGSEYEAGGEVVPALSGFRLVHESPETHRRVVPGLPGPILTSYVKIFERAPGVRLEGSAPPGTVVRLRIPVTTNAGRRFDYLARTLAGGDSRFALVAPYPAGSRGEVAAEAAEITLPGCSLHLALSEVEVESGVSRIIRCP